MTAEIIRDHTQLQTTIEGLKRSGKKIIFANGCFDILHVGHIRYLQEAKRLGDLLVVAVNDDASMRALKGEGHPYMPEEERLEILAALRCIDYLTLFTEKTVDSLLLQLKPDVQAKGTDYTKETVPERETVLSYGGEIAITGDKKTHSSSWIKSDL
ncbi:MAG: D-glycero-beta-D-manno-heptose 1-phosphate adenylyltransferase [Candidatus Scalindua sp. AMX11]|nr:MAG: D-glycero-beta-D-manno-heptose 1-phosphate adenylyltransferase [Candidatus Scalindua sp.]NOG82636.1 adenylyltransferase/cytidyltransferase family protein [Planctomycetota bacterium]RZV95212.1 MAG: D-glycero-beta-D-manno-heptose 1-phosphate adenylyltransferase [Candidatus Scalindua sp. SCAELEC01]TDE66309.1 MAG: D-glycero-beta-D-manno-heptose 1-phosphate adenylyltransferase [Candidatus Scalindua sp. AMX11]GJQ57934.1 MAG: glycerol-3-phosphate cytidylyltransferase [Candidatus Scalindua sp.]